MIILCQSTAFVTKFKIDLQENSRVSIPDLRMGPLTWTARRSTWSQNRTPIDHGWPLWSQKSPKNRTPIDHGCSIFARHWARSRLRLWRLWVLESMGPVSGPAGRGLSLALSLFLPIPLSPSLSRSRAASMINRQHRKRTPTQ